VVLIGRHGAMNPAGGVRCNIKSTAKGYSRVYFFGLRASRFRLSSGCLEDWFSLERFFPLST
jgi:hypothetical protein